MYYHNKAQQSNNRVHISWDILYTGYDTQNRMRPLCLGSICREQLLRTIGMEIWAQVWMRVH